VAVVTLAGNEVVNPDGWLDRVATVIAQSMDPAERKALTEAYEASHQLPQDVDRRLLTQSRASLRRDLLPHEKKALRRQFIRACVTISAGTTVLATER
jgi:hypothetical protein